MFRRHFCLEYQPCSSLGAGDWCVPLREPAGMKLHHVEESRSFFEQMNLWHIVDGWLNSLKSSNWQWSSGLRLDLEVTWPPHRHWYGGRRTFIRCLHIQKKLIPSEVMWDLCPFQPSSDLLALVYIFKLGWLICGPVHLAQIRLTFRVPEAGDKARMTQHGDGK